MKAGRSSHSDKILAQLLIDAESRGIHRLGDVARTGFVTKKPLRQISHFGEGGHVQSRIAPSENSDFLFDASQKDPGTDHFLASGHAIELF